MKRFFKAVSLSLLALSVCAQQQVDFEEEVTYIDSLIEVGNFQLADTSLSILRTSIEGTSLLEEDTVQLYFTSNQALVSYRLGNCAKTITFSTEDTKLRRLVYGDSSLLTLSAMRNLGVYYLNCDSTERAKEVLEQTIDLHTKNIGTPDEVYVRSLDDLAFTYSKLGESGKAIDAYEELLKMLGNSKGGFYIHVIENYSAFLTSIEKYEESAAFFPDLIEPMSKKEDYPTFLKDYYNVFIHLQDYVKALETASKISKFCNGKDAECQSRGIDPKEYILSSARLAMLLSNYEEAREFYTLAESEYYQDPQTYITVLSEEAELFRLVGNRALQRSKLDVLIGVHEKNDLTDSASYTRAVLQMGKLYTETGKFKEADELFSGYIEALEARGDQTDPTQLAIAYQSLGNQRYFLQNFKDADLYLIKARDLLRAEGLDQTKEYASVLNSLGALYEGLSSFRRAENSYRSALDIVSEEPSALRISLASNLANILLRNSPESDSIDLLFNQSIAWQIDLTGKNHPTYANMLGNRAVYFQSKDLNDQAEEDFKEAISVFEYSVNKDHPQYLSTVSNLGLLYQEMDRKQEALDLMLSAKASYEKYYAQTHPGFIRTLNNLANLYTTMERYDEAETLLMDLATIQVKEINESFSYLSESEKKDFVKEKQRLLDNFKGYVVARTVTEEGSIKPHVLSKWYDLELSTKGMLLNSTKKVRDHIFNSGNPELIGLFAEWTAARKQIADIQSLKNVHSSSSQSLVDSLTKNINDLEKEITRVSQDFGNSFANAAPTYNDLRLRLSPGEASLEIIRTQIEEDVFYIALIGSANNAHPEILVIGKGEELEGRSFNGYRNKITFKVEDAAAFEAYWRSIHGFLSKIGVNKIYYAPDGVYHKISLVTLYNPDTENYLLDELEIVQLTSTKDLMTIKEQPLDQAVQVEEVLLVGRPSYNIGGEAVQTNQALTRSMGQGITDLPGTEEEIMEIGQVLEKGGVRCELRLRDEASEKEVKALLNTELVHIATHGFFFDKEEKSGYHDPMINSGLLLAGVVNEQNESGEDGILTAYEIMNLDLSNTDMIVLSACETALGEVTSGEGIYGLQRAFFVGGANTLIMSLWKVDDQATKDLMTSFYKEYLKKGDKRSAFLAAQRKIKKKYKSPVYWGAFVMLGG